MEFRGEKRKGIWLLFGIKVMENGIVKSRQISQETTEKKQKSKVRWKKTEHWGGVGWGRGWGVLCFLVFFNGEYVPSRGVTNKIIITCSRGCKFNRQKWSIGVRWGGRWDVLCFLVFFKWRVWNGECGRQSQSNQ